MNEQLHFEVRPESIRETGTILHGIVGEYQGKPVVFMYDSSVQDIIIHESLEPIYPAITEAVIRYLRQSGRMK